ncbi:MAG: AraC family transcriptional regulator [Hyphomicrobiales bacterium]
MTQKPNPDIYRPIHVPDSLKPYIRRALIADSNQLVDMSPDVHATGYHYFGWIWRGRWQGQVNGEIRFDSDNDGPLHLSGQVKKAEVIAKMQRDVGQIFLEFSALGHFQLLGITGERMLEDAQAPHLLNPALKPHFEKILEAENISISARMALLTDVLSHLPKHSVPKGIIAAIELIEAVDGDIRIANLINELGLTERKFRTEFKMLIGLTPKSFCKTLQINRALNQLLMSNGGNLAGIAVQTGFSDQAHFTRAFRDFLGNSPRGYLENIEVTLARFVGQSRQ